MQSHGPREKGPPILVPVLANLNISRSPSLVPVQ